MGGERFREHKICGAFHGNFFGGFILLPFRGTNGVRKKKIEFREGSVIDSRRTKNVVKERKVEPQSDVHSFPFRAYVCEVF